MKEKEGSLWAVYVINPLDLMISMLIIFFKTRSLPDQEKLATTKFLLTFFETNNIRVKIKLLSAASHFFFVLLKTC